jgi:hypothetical protein
MKKQSKKYTVKKAQLGINNKPFVQTDTFAKNAQEDSALSNMSPEAAQLFNASGGFKKWQQQNQLLTKDNTPNIAVDHSQPQKQSTFGIGDARTELNPAVVGANYVMQGVTGIANIINDNKENKAERMQYLHAIEPKYYENMERYGLNANPMYNKFGGKTALKKKYAFGGIEDPKNPGIKGRPNPPTGTPLSPNPVVATFKTQAELDAANMKAKAFAAAHPNQATLINPEDVHVGNKVGDPIPQYVDANGNPVTGTNKNLRPKAMNVPDYINLSDIQNVDGNYFYEDKNGRNIDVDSSVTNLPRFRMQKAVVNPNDSETPKFQLGGGFRAATSPLDKIVLPSPTYNFSNLNPTNADDSAAYRHNFYGVLNREDWALHQMMTYGKYGVPTINSNGTTDMPTYISNTNQMNAMNDAQQQLDNPSSRPNPPKFWHPNKKQTGGDVQGLPDGMEHLANVEAERGEVVQNGDGSIDQISNSEPTHEQGGVFLPDVHRVLENTSNLRKDKDSKYLKLSSDAVKNITGADVNGSMSHAQALVKADEQYEKERSKVVKNIQLASKDKKQLDKLAENSTKLNLNTLKSIPSKQQIFDSLFNHQEAVKAEAGIETGQQAKMGGKFALGGVLPTDPIDPYTKSKTKEGSTTPTNMSNHYNRDANYLKNWETYIPGISGMDNKTAQAKVYDYMMSTPEGKERLSQMWKTYGLTNEGKKYKDLTSMTKNGVFTQDKLDDNQLLSLKKGYTDGLFGARQVDPFKPFTLDETPETKTVPEQHLDTSIHNNVNLTSQPQSRFFEPLRWYDVASPVNAYMNALNRIPEKYNPAEYNQLRYKLQDPTAALNQNQADFNSSTQAINNTTAGAGSKAANIANLAASKYAANNQILGQYENQNAQIKNNEITYNTQVRDKNNLSDQQARESFEEKVLTSKAKQDEQKLTALDSLYKTFAENRALNRNGNLIMKFAPAFDQYGEYNGYQHQFSVNPMLGLGMGNGFAPSTGYNGSKQQQYMPGQKYRFGSKMYQYDGRSFKESK